MRIAVISDVHGNLPALEAALEDIAQHSVAAAYHLGDLVGYGPWPNEVVSRIIAEGIAGVAGNYDTTVALGHPGCGCQHDDPRHRALSAASFRWSSKHVTEETKRYLASLPFRLDLRPLGGHRTGPTVTLVHGSAVLNTVYWHEDRSDRFCRKMFDRLGTTPGDAVLFGHTHKPWKRSLDDRLLVNTGSVGRPKDGDPRGSYVLFQVGPAGIRADIVRFRYDIGLATTAIARAGLPPGLAAILETGGTL